MQINEMFSSFIQNTEYPVTADPQSPIVAKTSAVSSTYFSPIKDFTSAKCPDSADSIGSLEGAFMHGINIESPNAERSTLSSSSSARDLSTHKSRALFDEKMGKSSRVRSFQNPSTISTLSEITKRRKTRVLNSEAEFIPEEFHKKRPRGTSLFADDLSIETQNSPSFFIKKSHVEKDVET